MDVDEFWFLLERSARETQSPRERTRWLERRLGTASTATAADFHHHLNAARRLIDTYAMWGAAYQIMDGLCSDDGFWYFQPWLIGQGRRWYDHAARDPDYLADVPAVRALAGRPSHDWSDAEWPQWEELAYVAPLADARLTARQDSLFPELAERSLPAASSPAPADRPWDFDNPAEIQRRLPRISQLFPRRR
jgi:hypothetical protein